MALFPIHARERDALGMFKAHSTFGTAEGGSVVRLAAEATDPKVTKLAAAAPANTVLHGLLDEQVGKPGTLLGSYLPQNSSPVVLGPATNLASGRASVWLDSGWFMTDHYSLAVDAYGEASTLSPGDMMYAEDAGATVGRLTDTAGVATRVRFMKMVNDVSDLLATRVSPAETTGMFAEKAPILIYQA
jgi:hypothetical protein